MSSPNTWAKATVKNDWGKPIKFVQLKHRYDNDHYDEKAWGLIESGKSGETVKVGYWTGFGRSGKDYWHITFSVDGKTYTCKDNFYCFLTSDDKNKTVVCRLYRDGDKPKMEVQCPGSSNCTVSLTTGTATPNTWATATVKNDWGSPIKAVSLKHRYDDDHYNDKSWPLLKPGESGAPFKVGYWTGFGRTGKDYWLISFIADGKYWSCKDTFDCTLTGDDRDKEVVCRVYKKGGKAEMQVICPGSSDCTVSLSSATATPNTWAKATIKNDWSSDIRDVTLSHRYDNDHYSAGNWKTIAKGKTGSPDFKVGYWTGFGRTGYDYWRPEFVADGKIWTCKDNFYCFLTDADKDRQVVCRVYKTGSKAEMQVICPGSSDCTVTLTSRDMSDLATARPIYVIAHRCNDVEDIGLAVSRGANAVECDLQYDATTKQIFVNHDLASGTNIFEWLNNAKAIAEQYGDKFALVYFDCKLAADRDPVVSGAVLKQLRDAAREILTVGKNPINLIFSVSDFDKRDALAPLMADLRANEGLAIDEYDKPADVEAYFSGKGVANAWYADGITTMWTKTLFPQIKKGAELRDANKKIKKVYVWTLSLESSIREYIVKAKVDGVMVNVPGTTGPSTGLDEALNIVGELPEARLARRSDPPFKVHVAK